MSASLSPLSVSEQQFDASRPYLPPKYFEEVLNNVTGRNNYLDLGMETGSTFFQLYHEFQGDVVGLDQSVNHAAYAKAKAELILPTQALNRTRLAGGQKDLLEVAENLHKKFDLVTVGAQVDNFGNIDRFFEFVKEKLLTQEGTLALTQTTPASIEFNTCYDESENVALKKNFSDLQEMLSEYEILPNNPVYNHGVHLRHFSRSQKLQHNIENLFEAEQLIAYLQTMPSYAKYMKDESQCDKYALRTFERKLKEKIARRSTHMTKQQSLLRVTQKVLTFLLKK